jgi:hypothetical protein
MWEARQYCLARGLEWDPQQPFANAQHLRTGRCGFAAQDAEARHADFQAAREAGLVHLLHQSPPGQSPPPSPASDGGSPTGGGDTGIDPRAGQGSPCQMGTA